MIAFQDLVAVFKQASSRFSQLPFAMANWHKGSKVRG